MYRLHDRFCFRFLSFSFHLSELITPGDTFNTSKRKDCKGEVLKFYFRSATRVYISVFVQDQTSARKNGGLPFSPRHVTTGVAVVKAIKNKANVASDEVCRSRGEQKPWSCPDHKVAITEQSQDC